VSISVAFVALLAGVVVWAVLARRLIAKPWETPGTTEPLHGDNAAGREATGVPSARIGLWILLAVITSLFGLFISAYWMRMEHGHGDWNPIPIPRVLWLNTAALILSSASMQLARAAARGARPQRVKVGLIAGGLLALAFLAGQLLAWHQLNASGYFVAGNPATAFFYLLTGVHGLHLLGGLVVWARTVARMTRSDVELIDVRLSVELCTVYWHYLLLVWLVLFAVLLST
jgi:cytochrome c oxidase subunit III